MNFNKNTTRTTVILGAGFSKNSGIPVQAEIPLLLTQDTGSDEFEHAVSIILKRFMENVFGYYNKNITPGLDDIFTCIDVSTNSGHHLGIGYSPEYLRAVRRVLVYRVFNILEKYYILSEDVKQLLELSNNKFANIDYVVLNWDTVLENYLLAMSQEGYIDYCSTGELWKDSNAGKEGKTFRVAKIHGSSNWLYCDNCRILYYDINNNIPVKMKAGFQVRDFEILDEFKELKNKEGILFCEKCQRCGNPVSSHIATFSYRKSFRANSFPDIWHEAEKMLSNSDRWIFIGYSLPDADYEFKHLLKISQLKFEHIKDRKLNIDIVLLNADDDIMKYRAFFGNKLNVVCNGGIKEYSNYI